MRLSLAIMSPRDESSQTGCHAYGPAEAGHYRATALLSLLLVSMVIFSLVVSGFSRTFSASFTQTRNTSATLHACAMQPRGVKGVSASNTSLIDPMHAS